MDNLKKIYILLFLVIAILGSIIFIQQMNITKKADNLFELEKENETLIKKRSELNYRIDELTTEIDKYKNN